MNGETMLKEILNALKLHGEQMDKRFMEMDAKFENKFVEMDEKFEKRFAEVDARFAAMERKFEKKFTEMDKKFDKRFDDMDQRFDRLEKKVDGFLVDLTDTQEVTDFLLSRTAKHEKKIHNLTSPQN